jgi:hypothetical protein
MYNVSYILKFCTTKSKAFSDFSRQFLASRQHCCISELWTPDGNTLSVEAG